jgi:hypothetical protein
LNLKPSPTPLPPPPIRLVLSTTEFFPQHFGLYSPNWLHRTGSAGKQLQDKNKKEKKIYQKKKKNGSLFKCVLQYVENSVNNTIVKKIFLLQLPTVCNCFP